MTVVGRESPLELSVDIPLLIVPTAPGRLNRAPIVDAVVDPVGDMPVGLLPNDPVVDDPSEPVVVDDNEPTLVDDMPGDVTLEVVEVPRLPNVVPDVVPMRGGQLPIDVVGVVSPVGLVTDPVGLVTDPVGLVTGAVGLVTCPVGLVTGPPTGPLELVGDVVSGGAGVPD